MKLTLICNIDSCNLKWQVERDNYFISSFCASVFACIVLTITTVLSCCIPVTAKTKDSSAAQISESREVQLIAIAVMKLKKKNNGDALQLHSFHYCP